MNILVKYTLIAAGLLVIIFIPDMFFFDGGHSVCIHLNIFGFQCPLCGMTRAVHEVSEFNLRNAVGYNFNVLFLPVYLVFDIFALRTGKEVFFRLRKWSVILLITGLILLYISRIVHHFGLLH